MLSLSIIRFFINSLNLRGLNHTHVIPVPKKYRAQFVDDYKPISLYNGVNKILSKLLTNQINCVKSKCIKSGKSVFLKGRQIINNVVIAGECVKYLKYKHKKFSNSALKLSILKTDLSEII